MEQAPAIQAAVARDGKGLVAARDDLDDALAQEVLDAHGRRIVVLRRVLPGLALAVAAPGVHVAQVVQGKRVLLAGADRHDVLAAQLALHHDRQLLVLALARANGTGSACAPARHAHSG